MGRILPAFTLGIALGMPWIPCGAPAQPSERAETARSQQARHAVELSAPVELIWQVLTDFASWPHFMPHLRRLHVRDRGPEGLSLDHETERWGFDLRYTTTTELDPLRLRVDLALDPAEDNDLVGMAACWQITPLRGGLVRVELRSHIDSGQPVPSFVEAGLLRRSVVAAVAALALEVERRRGEP